MPKLVLKAIPGGNGMDTAYEVHDDVATKMVEEGKAIRLPDGVLREVVKVEKPKAKKVEAEYTTKEMKPVKKAAKKG